MLPSVNASSCGARFDDFGIHTSAVCQFIREKVWYLHVRSFREATITHREQKFFNGIRCTRHSIR
jgi:hypothetical protein